MSFSAQKLTTNLEFNYGRSTIEYHLIYEDRKNLAITVKPDKTVLVKAPVKSTLEEIQEKLHKRGQWILKQINYFDKFHPIQPEREYVSGETHYYLGRQYRLRILKGKEEEVKLKGKFFIAKTMKTDDTKHIKNLMENWYATHAQMLIDQRVKRYVERVLAEGYGELKTKYIYLKGKWGRCDLKDSITFNIELVKTPIDCIDYVIVHELIHLVNPYHDKYFYNMLFGILPDWKERKNKLELFGGKL